MMSPPTKVISALVAALLPFARAITPELMLAAPRRSAATVNPTAQLAVFTSTTYDWAEHEPSTTWNLLHVATGNISELPWGSEVSEVLWIGPTDTSVIYINRTNDEVSGGISIWSADIGAEIIAPSSFITSLAAPFSGFKARQTENGDINWIASSLAYANNGSAYNSELATEPYSTARYYDSIYIRHWDAYISHERYAVFAGTLGNSNGTWAQKGDVRNLISALEYNVTRPETPVQPFGDSGDFDLSPDGTSVVFLTKAPHLPKANYTASYIYQVPFDGSSAPKAINGPGSPAPETAKGASSSPRFSPDGRYVAYGQQDGISYESDRIKLYLADLNSGEIKNLAPDWDLSVGLLKWGPDGQHLYVGADYIAATKLFIIPVNSDASFIPKNVTGSRKTSITDFDVLPNGNALVSSNAVWTSRNFYTVTPESHIEILFAANDVDPGLTGLHPEDFEEFWYPGSQGDLQHSVLIKPTNFSADEKYPLVFYIHGGPQGYTGNTWSTRWNLRTWADQGYVLIGPNPTGSTSFGQKLTDNITNEWGSYPYEDLINAYNYAKDNYDYIDFDNAIGAGASYGGFMTNWIQGHDFGRKFKALVTHDGTACGECKYQTDEIWFINHDNNGTWLNAMQNYNKFDPLDHAANFSTPHFIVHSDLDYRLPVGDGIALFNVLQEKGVPSRFLNFPNENHWVQDRENSLVWHTEIYNWINYWTGKVDSLSDTPIKS
ncbi:alpha/beta-hydrolase [Pseudovirgaria hyperparasitica]|uniref:Dipeptidyl-peptidase V n=1 Tax=Pseudovirgaria hyperparasitica TaxID=470096 RepID=A0A6A6VSZ6_9PEZI|nr:alpha/beta-hydrolase [Pseudovirgaria hyperparasitica]KAF2752906.1 alpha/beta-hydrolase [Pseudovirgaria hyperparasitica]